MKKRYPFQPKIWLCAILLTAFAATFSLNLQAQTAPAKQWDKTIGGIGDDGLWSISLQKTSDGGYIIGGTSDSPISGDKSQASKGGSDYWVVKLDSSGNKLWDKTFGGSGADVLTSLQQTSNGGYILAGYSSSGISGDKSQANQGSNDYWVVKLDASGNKTWDKSFGGSGDERLASLKLTFDGGYILGGGSNFSGQNNSNYWVVKLDASGNKTWDKTFSGGGYDDTWLSSLQQTSDGGYILGGSSEAGIGGDKSEPNKGLYYTPDFWVLKLDSNGNKIWDKTLGGNSHDWLLDLQQTSDGGYILGGFSCSGISGDKSQARISSDYYDCWVIKLDANGNKIWDKTIGCGWEDGITSLQQTSDGGYILGGWHGDENANYMVVKLDASGNKRWGRTFGGSGWENLASIQQTPDGGYILGGYSDSGLSGDKSQANKGAAGYTSDFWIVKLAPEVPYLTTDVAVSAITSANSGCLSGQETITITVNNLGTTSQSNIPVSYKINNSNPVNEVVPGPLAPNASVSYSFNTKANLGTSGIYNIEARTNLTGDAQSINDAFKKVITAYAIPPAPGINVTSPLTICSGDSVALIAVSAVPGATFTWFKDGNVIASATAATYMAKTAGSYTATATANGCPSPASLARTVAINPTPATPTITQTGYVLTSSSSSGNQWYKDNVVIAGATTQTYTATSNGSYTVVVTDNGCQSAASNAVVISTTGVESELNALNVAVHPNPSSGLFTIILPENGNYELTVTDLTGKLVKQFATKGKDTQLNLSNAAKGVYLLKIFGERKMVMRKLIME